MTPENLANILKEILDELNIDVTADSIIINRPKSRDFGDWSTNCALQNAKKVGKKPIDLAKEIASKLEERPEIKAVDVVMPGFINIWIQQDSLYEIIKVILNEKSEFGKTNAEDLENPETINLEYVSANPTGPLHIGGARWAAVGDSLARILKANGKKVIREYYFNDHGVQIDNFGVSLYKRANGLELDENDYAGDYIKEIADQVVAIYKEQTGKNLLDLPEDEQKAEFKRIGLDIMFKFIEDSMRAFRTEFDVYFHESSLYESGEVADAINLLKSKDEVYEKDGATWIRTSKYGDDKDRVVKKSNGEFSYFAADVAYYRNKRNRGADKAVYILGADHHGYVNRLIALASTFGDDPKKNIKIIIGQLVNLTKNGHPVRMGKRAGNIITLEDLTDAIGVDAGRYALTRSSMDTPLDIDIDMFRKQNNENPVYYVQYAHARTCSIKRNAEEANFLSELDINKLSAEELNECLAELKAEEENDLITCLANFKETIKLAGDTMGTQKINRYLEELATNYHKWYSKCKVLPKAGEKLQPVHKARFFLSEAAGIVLKNGLDLLGVSAPERM